MHDMPAWTVGYIPCLGYLMFDWNTRKYYWEGDSARAR